MNQRHRLSTRLTKTNPHGRGATSIRLWTRFAIEAILRRGKPSEVANTGVINPWDISASQSGLNTRLGRELEKLPRRRTHTGGTDQAHAPTYRSPWYPHITYNLGGTRRYKCSRP